MLILGIENFEIELLHTVDSVDDDNFVATLETQERHFILEYNSIKNGWNKVLPSGNKKSRKYGDQSTTRLARENGIPYTTLLNRLNKSDLPTAQVIREILEDRSQRPLVYSYGRKPYYDISSLAQDARINAQSLDKKTIERRIRKLKNSIPAPLDYSSDDKIIPHLTDEIFDPIKKRSKNISLNLPDGQKINGSIKTLHKISYESFPEIVPQSYTTIQARLSNRQKDHWTPEEAFGFQVPPNYREKKHYVEEKNYSWKPEKPTENAGSPVVVHSLKEIFISQTTFANEFKIKTDMVSDYLQDGLTPDEILKKFKIIES